jgi:hypothetical protein
VEAIVERMIEPVEALLAAARGVEAAEGTALER